MTGFLSHTGVPPVIIRSFRSISNDGIFSNQPLHKPPMTSPGKLICHKVVNKVNVAPWVSFKRQKNPGFLGWFLWKEKALTWDDLVFLPLFLKTHLWYSIYIMMYLYIDYYLFLSLILVDGCSLMFHCCVWWEGDFCAPNSHFPPVWFFTVETVSDDLMVANAGERQSANHCLAAGVWNLASPMTACC